jgi:hypothetical protein
VSLQVLYRAEKSAMRGLARCGENVSETSRSAEICDSRISPSPRQDKSKFMRKQKITNCKISRIRKQS